MILNSRLKEIASWPASYYETGIASSEISIGSMDVFLRKLSDVSIPEPSIYPTHTNGLVAEWSLQDSELTAEIDSGGEAVYLHALNMVTDDVTEITAILNSDFAMNMLLTVMRNLFYNPNDRV